MTALAHKSELHRKRPNTHTYTQREKKVGGNMAKTSHSWPTKKSTRVSEKNGKQVTEIKCSSCTAVQKKR